MGRVYRARDTVLRRQVALKYLLTSVPEKPGSTSMRGFVRDELLREVRAMAGLRHESLCRVLEIVQEAPDPFIVMEWIEGVDLRSAWASMDRSARLALLVKIVDAVTALHAADVTHRDLKPGNMLIDARGQPVIVDFGLATRGVDGISGGGTAGYAAPEQFEPNAPVGPRADVFALGVLLFEMLTDQRPFTGETVEQIVEKTRTGHPPLPETLAPDAPSGLQRICLAAMERDPARRYATAKEMGEDLRRFIRGEVVVARPSILAEQFAEVIEEQIGRTRQWERHGLITPVEARSLQRQLMAIQRPDSPWIVDSRRLSSSQVGLYLGGWLSLVAIAIGFARSWDGLSPTLKLGVPIVFTLGMCALGLWLQAKDYRRVALAYLITGCLGVPVTMSILFRQTHWLSADGVGMGVFEAFARIRIADDGTWVVRSAPPQGLFNLQILVAAIAWLGACVLGRWLSKSSAFTLLGCLASLIAWCGLWLVNERFVPGNLDRDAASLGAFVLVLSVVAFAAGCLLSNAEQELQSKVGIHRTRRSDAWSVLTLGVVGGTASITVIAVFRPEWYLLPKLISELSPDIARIALAFMINGLLLLLASGILMRRLAPSRESLALFLRWIIPSHFLASLQLLHHENVWDLHGVWLGTAAITAVTLCFISVWKQWKPFLVNGLFYFAVVYFRAFDEPWFRGDLGHSILALGALGIGIGAMVLAWRLPSWTSAIRLRGWMNQARASAARSLTKPPPDRTY